MRRWYKVERDGRVMVLDFAARSDVCEPEDLIFGFRSTTSSRRPGLKIEGIVVARKVGGAIVLCPKCGCSMRADWPHRMLASGGGTSRLVDCAGAEVSP